MSQRNPSPVVSPRDPVLGPLKGFLDWVHRRLDAEVPPTYVGTLDGWNPPNIASSPGTTSTTVTVRGARFSTLSDVGTFPAQPVTVGCSQTLPSGSFLVAHVSANDEVTVTLVNLTGAALNLGTIARLRVCVWGYT